MMKVLDLFSGIGGFSLGLERTGGFETVAFCEIDKNCHKTLGAHWKGVEIHNDITTARFKEPVDLVTAGFPCQDISHAGEGAGLEGERSGLFWHILRAASMVGSPKLLLENVAALLHRGLSEVLGALAQVGYDTEWHCIPASHVGLPHGRDRMWIFANPKQNRRICLDAHIKNRLTPLHKPRSHPRWASTLQLLPPVGEFFNYTGEDIKRNDNGLPGELDAIGAFGNAVVPQIPEIIGHAILQAEAS